MNLPGWLVALLRVLPEDFRETYRGEVEDFVAEELSRAGWRRPWVAGRMAADLVVAGVRLRLRPVRRGIWKWIGRDRGEGWMMSGWNDLRLAARGLVRSPGFSGVVIVTLGLGIGLNTAIFSVVDTVLLRPLDYEDPERLVYLEASAPAHELNDMLHSGGDMRDLRSVEGLEAVEGIATIRQNLNGAGLPRQVEVGWVSGGFLDMLGADPVVGRLHRADDAPGKVVLGYPIWRDAFGSESAAVGRTIQLDGQPYEIIGVLPEDFRLRLPARGGATDTPELWKNPDSFWQNGDIWSAQGPEFGLLRLVGRLSPERSVDAVQPEVDALTADLRSRFSDYAEGDLQITVAGLQDRLVEGVRSTLTMLLGAVSLVLLIACGNVANLLLVRGQARRREMAVRMALGSPRSRVGRFLFLESLVLAVLGSTLGLVLAAWSVTLVPTVAPPDLPMADAVALDGSVLAFAVGAAVLTTLLVGALPAVAAYRADPGRVLGNGRSTGVKGGRVRDALVVAQVALSIILLVGAGLLTQSLVRMHQVDPGFSPEGLYTFGVSVPGAQYGWPVEADRFYRDVEERVAALPGVQSAGIVWPMPFSGNWSGGHQTVAADVVPHGFVDYRLATEAYFPTAGIPLVDGRHFRDGDPTHVVVVSESVAADVWPGRSALGRSLQLDPWGRGMEDFEVVGVVGDVRSSDVRAEPEGAVYFDSRSWSWVDWEVHVVARTDRADASLVPDLRSAIASIDPQVPLAHPAPLTAAIRSQTAPERFVLTLLGVFAGTAALLALVGLYGVISYTVGLRSREFGVRIALGSARSGIRRLVVGRGVVLTTLGLLLGLGGAWGVAGVLDAFLFEVTSTDPLTYLTVGLLLTAGAVGATWLPAWRASRLDPIAVLRAD